jgi:hypothetical protein
MTVDDGGVDHDEIPPETHLLVVDTPGGIAAGQAFIHRARGDA